MMSKLPVAVENDAARKAAGLTGERLRPPAKGDDGKSEAANGFSLALARQESDGKAPPPAGDSLPPDAPRGGADSSTNTGALPSDVREEAPRQELSPAGVDEHAVDLYAHLPESLRALYPLDESAPADGAVAATTAPGLAALAGPGAALLPGSQLPAQVAGPSIEYAARGLPDGGLAGQRASPAADSLARVLGVVRALHGMPPQGPGEGGGEFMRALAAATPEAPESRAPASLLAGAAVQAAPSSSASPAASPATPGSMPMPPSLPIPMAPDRPGWGEALGQRVLWMVSNNSQVAQLRLNPPDLGPVEVRVRTDDDGVRLSLAAGNTAVREALESATPRLREMFAAEGLQLDHVDIGRQDSGRGGGEAAGETADADDPARGETPAEPGATHGPGSAGGMGLVDCFI